MRPMSSPIVGHGGRGSGDGESSMRNAIVPTSFLRRVWWADAAVSAVVGAAVAGLSLLPYAAFLAWLATRSAVPRAAAWAPVLLKVVWAIDCAALGVMQA